MISRIGNFIFSLFPFRRIVPKGIIKLIPLPMAVPLTAPPISEKKFNHFLKAFHGIGFYPQLKWDELLIPIKCKFNFGGWGFMEGCVKYLPVMPSVMIHPFDDDMDLSAYCITIDRVPSLIIKSKRGHHTISIINPNSDYFEEIFNQANGQNMMPFDTYEQYNNLPESIKKIVAHLIIYICNCNKITDDNNPIEKIVNL
jgi:hypothetical protein